MIIFHSCSDVANLFKMTSLIIEFDISLKLIFMIVKFLKLLLKHICPNKENKSTMM